MLKSLQRIQITLRFMLVLAGVLLSSSGFAAAVRPPLNQIHYQLRVQTWVTAAAAKVVVSGHAMLGNQAVETLRERVLSELKQLAAKGNWHIIQFSQSPDPSGLEKVTIQAQARLPYGELSGLREKAKHLSKAGLQYSIASIDFSPSTAVLEKAREQLRNKVYAKIRAQLQLLNKALPDQHYVLHQLQFLPSAQPQPPAPQPLVMTREMITDQGSAASSAQFSVDRRLSIVVNVQLASKME